MTVWSWQSPGVWADSEADRGYPAPYPSYFPTDSCLRAFREKRVSVEHTDKAEALRNAVI